MGLRAVLCVLLLMFAIKSEQTCTELEVLGINLTQKEIKVKENSLFNLTVHLNKFTCHEKWHWSLVKLTTYDNGKHFDVCRTIVSNGMCNVAGSSQCVCLGAEFVQFCKQVTQEDTEEKTVSLALLLTITISCVCLVIIVVITAVCVVRHKRDTRVTTVRTSIRPPHVQEEEIHVYTAFYPQAQGHHEEMQNRFRNSIEMAESVGSRSAVVDRENQPRYIELTDPPDDYLESVQTN